MQSVKCSNLVKKGRSIRNCNGKEHIYRSSFFFHFLFRSFVLPLFLILFLSLFLSFSVPFFFPPFFLLSVHLQDATRMCECIQMLSKVRKRGSVRRWEEKIEVFTFFVLSLRFRPRNCRSWRFASYAFWICNLEGSEILKG